MTDLTKQTRIIRWEESSVWHEGHRSLSLGCASCTDLEVCGGLRLEAPAYSCVAFCCGNPKRCDRVCSRNLSNFVDRRREIHGFELTNVPRASPLKHPKLGTVVPLIANGSDRHQALNARIVALPLFRIVQATRGEVRFKSKEQLCDHFRIAPSSVVIASGVSQDGALERWWQIQDRSKVIEQLKAAGVDLVTTPNYSLFSAVPRWDNLHGMKRIALAWSEFQQAGLPAALHVNATSERDYSRWSEFIGERPEVAAIAFEFGTGAGFRRRIDQHVRWLCELGQSVDRPLTLIVRGAQRFLGQLAGSFARVVYIDTASFIKTQKRFQAELLKDGRIRWQPSPTLPGIALDALLSRNIRRVKKALHPVLTSRQVSEDRGGETDGRNKEAAKIGTLREIELPHSWR